MSFKFPQPAPVPTQEWPGCSSSHWFDTSSCNITARRTVPTNCRNGSHDSFARLGFGYFTAPNPCNEGRKLVPPMRSMSDASLTWRPRKRIAVPPSMMYREELETVSLAQQPTFPRRRVAKNDFCKQIRSKSTPSAMDRRSRALVHNLVEWEKSKGLNCIY
eukprot:GEMP01066327.1.p1 GENE.GEMP01066327.1~~GEMP01066327.1.p1  ORF type:complete len:161 (+),score=25.14 GEMP01066327.1:13-495(+)